MAKYKLQVEQTRVFTSTIVVETDMTEDELDSKLTEIERNHNEDICDLMYDLKSEGLKIIEESIDEDGELQSLEIPDMLEVE